MADDRRKHAIEIVARHSVALGGHWAVKLIRPGLSDADWSAVCDRAELIAQDLDPSEDEYDSAYDYLAGLTGDGSS